MESAHTTESVQAESSTAENIDVRVHSRLRPRAAKSQGLYSQVLDQKESSEGSLKQEQTDLKKSAASKVSPQPPSQGQVHQGQSIPETDSLSVEDASSENSTVENPVVANSSTENYPLEHPEALEIHGAQPDECDVISCVTFDASPEQSEEEDQASKSNTASSGIVDGGDSVSKKDLVALLEGFVKIIKTDEVTPGSGMTTATGTGIELSRDKGLITGEARIDDRTVEIDQLRGLVIEAQDTIIKLLTDRVDDRSRIATLEAQLNLLPDLQAQADRAMSVAVRTEDYRTELTKMKFELDRFRLFRVRIEAEQKKGSVFNRIQKWLFSRPNAKAEQVQRNNYQTMVDGTYVKPNTSSVAQSDI